VQREFGAARRKNRRLQKFRASCSSRMPFNTSHNIFAVRTMRIRCGLTLNLISSPRASLLALGFGFRASYRFFHQFVVNLDIRPHLRRLLLFIQCVRIK
jgi:hypothetical protein